jgi:hypothetical protein
MSLLDAILATARDQFPALMGSTVAGIFSKPEKKWHRAFTVAGGLVISQIFTTPTVEHFNLDIWVGPIGLLYGLSGIAVSVLILSLIKSAQDFGPEVVKGWLNRLLGGTNNGPD